MMIAPATGYLTPTPPFDFAKSLEFLKLLPPLQNQQAVAVQSLTKAVFVGGQLIGFQLQSKGTVKQPKLEYTLFAEQPITQPIQDAALDRIAFFLSLEDDLQPFYRLGQTDLNFAPLIDQLYGYHQVKFLTPFEAACWAVLTQRTPFSTAHEIKQALVENLGGFLSQDGRSYAAFPEPEKIAALSQHDLAGLVRNQRKAGYLSAIAAAFCQVDEKFLRTEAKSKVETWLRQIKGIGAWSAAFILLRGLGRTESVPLSERRLIEAIAQVYPQSQTMSNTALARLAARYGPWQGYWAHYLRVAT
jgi:DNA-3-methyladenine glycosylase II